MKQWERGRELEEGRKGGGDEGFQSFWHICKVTQAHSGRRILLFVHVMPLETCKPGRSSSSLVFHLFFQPYFSRWGEAQRRQTATKCHSGYLGVSFCNRHASRRLGLTICRHFTFLRQFGLPGGGALPKYAERKMLLDHHHNLRGKKAKSESEETCFQRNIFVEVISHCWTSGEETWWWQDEKTTTTAHSPAMPLHYGPKSSSNKLVHTNFCFSLGESQKKFVTDVKT